MKRAILAVGAAVLLSACGAAGDKAAMINTCTKEGTDKKVCECTVNEMEKNMDKKAFAVMAKASVSKDANSEKAMQGLTLEQQMSAATAAMGAAMKCGLQGGK